MPVLRNAKHELFAQELAKGTTATEAYVIAGYKPDDGTACKLAGKPDIQDRVQEITGKGAELAAVTVASILIELEEARLLAVKIEQPASAVTASMGKAKLCGLLADRVEHAGKIEIEEVSEFEIARRIAFAMTKGRQSGETPTIN